jgi:four helix bundle protein
VWEEGMNLAEMGYEVTRKFTRKEVYRIASQARWVAATVPANVAEGRGRDNSREFDQFLRIAQGSLKEQETRLMLAPRVELRMTQKVAPILKHHQVFGSILRTLICSTQKKQGVAGGK